MEVVHFQRIVLVEDHHGIPVRAREVIGLRAQEDRLAEIGREVLHEAAQAVQQV